MKKYKLAFIIGSLRKDSYNKAIAQAVAKLYPEEFDIEFIDIAHLPLYNTDTENDSVPVVEKFKQSIRAADAIVFFTPEYNRSIPSALKNALDVGSRPYGQSVWTGKPAIVGGVSIGAIGTAVAQQQLRSPLAFFDMPVMAQPEFYFQYKEGVLDGQHNFTNADTRAFVQSWVNAGVAWVKKHVG